ncbi:hypothetical protein Pmani_026056 [Petrolisthes manimaculis]|uniref:Uncharacterized protein n=1 Tax=Petrolisthes manimaculis TaxID=1843537 RepID=A0AAE1TY79_9EUCA|nr:hypothetical protein Pmani_026056 [Petrolisthes manimaculis]
MSVVKKEEKGMKEGKCKGVVKKEEKGMKEGIGGEKSLRKCSCIKDPDSNKNLKSSKDPNNSKDQNSIKDPKQHERPPTLSKIQSSIKDPQQQLRPHHQQLRAWQHEQQRPQLQQGPNNSRSSSPAPGTAGVQ